MIDARHVTLNLPILRLKNGRANQISTLKGTRPYPMFARTGLNCSGSLPYLAWITFCIGEYCCAMAADSLVPRPPRPHAERRSGDFSRFSWHSSSIWDGPIRLQDFAYHAIVTFKLTCDGYPNPAPWARHNAQFADHALVAEMRMRISMCHMI